MKITWVLPGIDISGGVKAVFCLSNELIKRGHEVNIVYPMWPMGITAKAVLTKGLTKGWGIAWNIVKKSSTPLWFDLKANLVQVPWLSERFVPDADVVLATWWETAYTVAKLPQSKGRKFYFIQHYETWGGPKDKVDASYRLGLTNIVNSSWTQGKIEGVGGKIAAKILHAPDWEQFKEAPMLRRAVVLFPTSTLDSSLKIEDATAHLVNKTRILMPYRLDKWKGAEDGIMAYVLTESIILGYQRTTTKIKLVLFGSDSKDAPPWAEFHLRPSNAELNMLYRSCDIFLFPSWEEGFGMPPLEAMACGLPIVATRAGAVPDFAEDGITGFLYEPRDIEGMAKGLVMLISNSILRKQMGQAGQQKARQFTWGKATDELVKVLKA